MVRIKGKFPVFNTLATLAFERSGREDFFQEELEAFILLCLEQDLNINKIKEFVCWCTRYSSIYAKQLENFCC